MIGVNGHGETGREEGPGSRAYSWQAEDDKQVGPLIGKLRAGPVAFVVVTLAVALSACGTTAGETSATEATEATEPTEPTEVAKAQTSPVTVRGEALPPMPNGGGRDPAVGLTMLDVEGSSFDGVPVSIRNDGRPKVILFLTHW